MRILTIKIIIIIMALVGILGFAPVVSGQTARDIGDKQYVRVALKSGEIVNFEYRSFLEMNFDIQTGNPARPNPDEDFGEKRVVFTEKDSCTQHRISLDNLQAIEFMGITVNQCTQKKEWGFKVFLLDTDRYEGFFKRSASNVSKTLSQQGMMGQELSTSEARTLPFDGIEKIRFFPR